MVEINFFNKTLKIKYDNMNGSYFLNKKGIVSIWENNVIEKITLPILQILDKDNFQDQLLIDIGANIGSYCFLPLLLNKFKCHAYEPVKYIFDVLNHNIEHNSCSNIVKPFNLALGDQNTQKKINLSSNTQTGINTFGTNKKYFRKHVLDNKQQELCSIYTLDYMYKDNESKISYIKIDTEGFEFFILKGGLLTINKHRPIIQMEWNKNNLLQCDVDYNDIIKMIYSINYITLSIVGEELFLIPKEKEKLFKELKTPLHESYKNNPFFNWIK